MKEDIKCQTCTQSLTGQQKKFCSRICMRAFHNLKHQNPKNQKKRSIWRKLKLIKMFGGSCQKCSYKENMAALCFHHKNPSTKEFELDFKKLANSSWGKIINEANKCALLCHNCHAETHNPTLYLKELQEQQQFFMELIEDKPPKRSPKICICGNPKDRSAQMCITCHHKAQEKIIWPTNEELLKMLETNSYLSVARQLGVSDNAIRKRLKRNH